MSLAAIDQSAMLGGLRFHYREWPNSGAQALVLLHGFTGHARSWDSFAGAMQPKYHVYALDQRGHGDSEWAPDGDYGLDAFAGDVIEVARHLGNPVLVGASEGAALLEPLARTLAKMERFKDATGMFQRIAAAYPGSETAEAAKKESLVISGLENKPEKGANAKDKNGKDAKEAPKDSKK